MSGRPARIPTSSVATGQQARLHLDLRYDPDTGWIFAGDQLPVWPPGYPVPVIAFHGTADTFVSYDGGLGASVADLPTDDGGTIGPGAVEGDGPSVEEIAAAWAVRHGCAAGPPVVEAVSVEVDRLGHLSCPSNGQVDLYRVNGGGHA